MSEDEKDPIEEAAAAPASVEQDGTSVVEHSIPDKIEAERFAASKRAHRRRSTGLRFFRISPPGAV